MPPAAPDAAGRPDAAEPNTAGCARAQLGRVVGREHDGERAARRRRPRASKSAGRTTGLGEFTRPENCRHAASDRVVGIVLGRLFCRLDRRRTGCHDDIHLETDQLDGEAGKPVVLPLRPSELKGDADLMRGCLLPAAPPAASGAASAPARDVTRKRRRSITG